MTAQDVHDLAVALYALLPMTTLTAAPWEPEQQYAVADQLTAACEAVGIPEILGNCDCRGAGRVSRPLGWTLRQSG